MVLIFVLMMAMFLSYADWILGAQPIAEIGYYDLENTPPPSHARSFSINHGTAIYHRDGVPSEHPVKRNSILGAFFGLYAVFLALVLKSRTNAKRDGKSLSRES